MTDFATLGMKVDSSDVDKASQSLDNMTQSATKAEGATKRLQRTSGEKAATAVEEIRALEKLIHSYDRGTEAIEKLQRVVSPMRMQEYRVALREMADEFEKLSKNTEQSKQSSVAWAAAIGGAIGAVIGNLVVLVAHKAWQFLVEVPKQIAKEFLDAETTMIRLAATIKITGREAELSLHGLSIAAEEIGRRKIIDDEEIKRGMTVMIQQTRLGEEQIIKLAEVGADLSRIYGRDVSSVMMQLSRAMEAPLNAGYALRSLGIILNAQERERLNDLRKLRDEEGARVLLLELLTKKTKDFAEETNKGLAAAMNHLRVAAGNTYEALGKGTGIFEFLTGKTNDYAKSLGDLASILEDKTIPAYKKWLATISRMPVFGIPALTPKEYEEMGPPTWLLKASSRLSVGAVASQRGVLGPEPEGRQEQNADIDEKLRELEIRRIRLEKGPIEATLAELGDKFRNAEPGKLYQYAKELAELDALEAGQKKANKTSEAALALEEKRKRSAETLIQTWENKVETLEAEVKSEENLTAVERMMLPVLISLRDGTRQLSEEETIRLGIFLERAAKASAVLEIEKKQIAQNKEREKQEKALYDAQVKEIDATEKQVVVERENVERIGKTAEELYELEVAKLRNVLASKEMALADAESRDDQAEHVAGLRRHIAALRELLDLKAKGFQQTVLAQERSEYLKWWDELSENIGNGIANALFQGFTNGAQGGLDIWKTLVNTIRNTAIMVPIKFVADLASGTLQRIGSSIMGSIFPGLASAASEGAGGGTGLVGGILSSIGNAFTASGGGFSGVMEAIGAAPNILFQKLGSATGMQWLADIGNFGFGAPVLGAVTNLLMGNVKGAIGSAALGTIGNFIAPGIGGVIGSLVGGLFGGSSKGGPASYSGSTYFGSIDPWNISAGMVSSSQNSKQGFAWQMPTNWFGIDNMMQQQFAKLIDEMTKLGESLGLEDARARISRGYSWSNAQTGLLPGQGGETQMVQAALAQIVDQMAYSLVPRLAEFAQEGETATQTLVRLTQVLAQLRAGEEQAISNLENLVRQLPSALGITALETMQRSLEVAAFQAPMDRYEAAQKQMQEQFAAAMGGDLSAVGGFTQAFQSALTIAREVGASGPLFKEVFVEGNLMLQQLLEKQQAVQVDILKNVDITIQQSSQDQIGAIKSQTNALVDELKAIRAELRKIQGL